MKARTIRWAEDVAGQGDKNSSRKLVEKKTYEHTTLKQAQREDTIKTGLKNKTQWCEPALKQQAHDTAKMWERVGQK